LLSIGNKQRGVPDVSIIAAYRLISAGSCESIVTVISMSIDSPQKIPWKLHWSWKRLSQWHKPGGTDKEPGPINREAVLRTGTLALSPAICPMTI
jgi:hypothetical protein